MDSILKESLSNQIQNLEKQFIKELKQLELELSNDVVCSISQTRIEVGIAASPEWKERGWKMAFGSNIDLYAQIDTDDISHWRNEMSISSLGQFHKDHQECYWRVIHAASILKNWDDVFDLVNKYCNRYIEIRELHFKLTK